MPAWITDAEAIDYTGAQTADVDYLSALIPGVCVAVERFLGYPVELATHTKRFSGRGGTKLMLPDRPLVSVESLSINGQAVPAGSWTNGAMTAGWFADIENNMVELGGHYCFQRGAQNIAISYTAGWAAVPDDIKRAGLEWLKLMLGRRDINMSVTSERAGGQSLSYGAAVLAPMPPLALMLLNPYRRVAPC